MLVMHLTATPPPLHELVADVPAHVEAAIVRGLARTRDDRFDSIPSFLEALQGSAASGAIVLSQPEPAKALVVATEVLVARTAVLPASTTFSRTTGEVVAADDDEQLLATKQPRRWLPFAIGGVVAAGLGILLLVPGSHDSVPRATPVAEPTKAVEPVRQEILPSALPAVLPSKPDAGLAGSALAGTAPAANPERVFSSPAPARRRPHHEAKNEPLPKTPESAKPDRGASAQTPKKPPSVAGF
jgi:serine/threonine-protein kinase